MKPNPDREEDARMLDEILAKVDAIDEEDAPNTIPTKAFGEMRERVENGLSLSPKQRSWIKGVYERLFDQPMYENLVSSGKVRSEPSLATPTPEVLRRPLPMKPPGRR